MVRPIDIETIETHFHISLVYLRNFKLDNVTLYTISSVLTIFLIQL